MIELSENLLTTVPQQLAKDLRLSEATASQIRKFYDDLTLLQMKTKNLNLSEEEFKKKILPLVHFTKAKIAYKVGCKVVPPSFLKSISPYIEKIETIEDFSNFLLFYQAIIAYTKFAVFEQDQIKKQQQYGNSSKYGQGGRR